MLKTASTIWDYSLNSEAYRVVYAAHQLSVGFYQQKNFSVLPQLPSNPTAAMVAFPNLNYRQIKNFWKQVKSIDISILPIQAPKLLIENIIQQLILLNIQTPSYEPLEKIWNQACQTIIKAIGQLIPQPQSLIKSITIFPTNFGTRCSFNTINKFPANICIYLRFDASLFDLVEAILTSITRKNIYNKFDATWEESELLVDWLLEETYLKTVINQFTNNSFQTTRKVVIDKQQAKLKLESTKYLNLLGVDNQVNFTNYPLTGLNQKETKLWHKFISKQGQILNYDELAEIIFTNEDQFSFYAISKTVQRLREKLELNNIPGSVIQACRSIGYLLK